MFEAGDHDVVTPLFTLRCGCAACAGAAPPVGGLSGQKETVIANKISGDFRIDVLLDNNDSRWNKASPNGTPVEVTFSFPTTRPDYVVGEDAKGWSPFNAEQITVQRGQIAYLESLGNLKFREVPDAGGADPGGTIRFQNNSQGKSSAGYAYMPDQGTALAGDVFMNSDGGTYLSNIVPGSWAESTMLHELLHAVGMKHPGNYNAGEKPQDVPGNFLIQTEDTQLNSIMSYYNGNDAGLVRFGLGPYDLLAYQFLYGAKPARTDNTTYSIGDEAGKYLSMVYDSGGIDTIDASKSTVSVTLNLNEGSNASSSIGKGESGEAAKINVQIAFGTVIENAIGTAAADTFIGNRVNNVYRPNGGNDTVDGGAGIDTLVLSGARAAAQFNGNQITAGGATVTHTGFERFAFSDRILAFDTGEGQNAGTVYRVYQAAFNRQPDLPGVSFWTNLFDNGTPLVEITRNFTISAEFRQIYGTNPTNRQLIDAFYQNVLGRPGEQAGIDFWLGQLNGGTTVATALSFFTNGPENIARTAPALTGGIQLDPAAFLLA